MRPNRLALNRTAPKSLSTALAAALTLLAVAAVGRADDAPAAPAPATGTGVVTGKVNGPDGKPAAGVILRLVLDVRGKTTAADPGNTKKPKVAAGTATTNDTGDFRIDHLAPGHYVLTANEKGVGKARSSVVMTEGKTVEVTLQLVAAKKKV